MEQFWQSKDVGLRRRGAGRLFQRPSALVRMWAGDASGSTAVEFSLVAMPFVLIIVAVMVVGLQFFTVHCLEQGVTSAARKIKTGEAQKAGNTYADFRKMVCDAAGSLITCDSHLVVHVKSGTTFASLDPPIACLTNGTLTPTGATSGTAVSTYSGVASATVSVTACYQWDNGSTLWKTIWSLLGTTSTSSNGKTIISSTIAFRSEPYQ